MKLVFDAVCLNMVFVFDTVCLMSQMRIRVLVATEAAVTAADRRPLVRPASVHQGWS